MDTRQRAGSLDLLDNTCEVIVISTVIKHFYNLVSAEQSICNQLLTNLANELNLHSDMVKLFPIKYFDSRNATNGFSASKKWKCLRLFARNSNLLALFFILEMD